VLGQILSGVERLVYPDITSKIPPLLQRVHDQNPARAAELE
jgi:hypothetical protein